MSATTCIVVGNRHTLASDHRYSQCSIELATLHQHKIFSTPSSSRKDAANNNSRTPPALTIISWESTETPLPRIKGVAIRISSQRKLTPKLHLNSFLQPSRTRFSQQWPYCLKENPRPPHWPWVTTPLPQQPTTPPWQLQPPAQSTSTNPTSKAITRITVSQRQN
jgi:hypothetical protein